MAKVDKSQYTKEEWHKIREQRRQEKETKAIEESHDLDDVENYVLCLKHGVKYSSEYVNRLNRMIKRHCTVPFRFACLTDDASDLDSDIIPLPLPNFVSGWWCKPYMFSKDLPIKGNILYLDLDVVISNNIDKLFSYQHGHWCIVRDFTRAMRPKWPKYNSSVIRFRTGELDFVWEEFRENYKDITRRFHGDQDYLYDATIKKRGAMLWPDSWILSWKWEVRKSREFMPGSRRGNRIFRYDEHNAKPRPECCICVFHGEPNPHLIKDKWVVENWK